MATVTPTAAAPLDMGLRIRLSIMMFLQFAIWGAWGTVIGNYLQHIGFDKSIVGWVGSLMPLGAILAPLIVSQLADRFVKDPRDVVKAGDVVKVRVVEVDVARKRIALTMRSGEAAAAPPAAGRPPGSRAAPPRPEPAGLGGLGAKLAEAMKGR